MTSKGYSVKSAISQLEHDWARELGMVATPGSGSGRLKGDALGQNSIGEFKFTLFHSMLPVLEAYWLDKVIREADLMQKSFAFIGLSAPGRRVYAVFKRDFLSYLEGQKLAYSPSEVYNDSSSPYFAADRIRSTLHTEYAEVSLGPYQLVILGPELFKLVLGEADGRS